MRILIIDAKRLYADALAAYLLRNMPDVQVEEATGLDEIATREQAGRDPDLILLDFELAGVAGPKNLASLRERFPESRILGMADRDHQHVRDAVGQHGAGFVLKAISGPAMIKVLELVLSGESYIPPSLFGKTEDDARRGSDLTPPDSKAATFETLTTREREALQLVLEGLSNKEIARELGIKEVTAAFHLRGLFKKLGVSSRTQAATKALESGWKAAS